MKKFPEFRQKVSEGYFRLDLPRGFNQKEVDKGLQRFQELRKHISEKPTSDTTARIMFNHSFKE